jgi:hypothetical protein
MQTLVERRRRVSQRIIVEVDCDGIPLKKRYKVFDSFRAQVRRGVEGRALEAAVKDALANDPDLDDRESEFIRQAQKVSRQEISETFRRRLNRAIKMKVPGLAGAGRGGPTTRPPKPVVDLYPEPTTFTGPEAVTALIGARTSIHFEINAEDGFVPTRVRSSSHARLDPRASPSASVTCDGADCESASSCQRTRRKTSTPLTSRSNGCPPPEGWVGSHASPGP